MYRNLRNRIRLLFLRGKEPYPIYKKILGFYPIELSYYQIALVHKSFPFRVNGGRLVNNERLEFLGDSVLQSVVTDILYKYFIYKGEGFLSSLRARIVKRETLNQLAHEMGLDKLIKTANALQTQNTFIPGNAFEALIGAIYLDQGYTNCYRFIKEKILGTYFNLDALAEEEMDFKSKLLEWCQQRRLDICFELLSSSVDEKNNTIFTSQIHICGVKGGIGSGFSKKKSHQAASFQTFQMIKEDKNFMQQINSVHSMVDSKADSHS